MIDVRFIEGQDIGLSVIRSAPQTRDVQVDNSHVMVEFEGEDHEVATLLETILSQGCRVHSFGEKDPTLEDVFMMVTKGLVT